MQFCKYRKVYASEATAGADADTEVLPAMG